jgi:hypothetical protein
VLTDKIPAAIEFVSHRDFVRDVLRSEVNLTSLREDFIPRQNEPETSPSNLYRKQMNSEGEAASRVSAGYVWAPGTELARESPRTAIQTTVNA